MVQLSSILAIVACLSLTNALPLQSCPAGSVKSPAAPAPKTIYFMSNSANNSIVALNVAKNGTLSDGSVTLTGGAGMNGIDAATGKPAAPDSLFSQGPVKTAGNILIAANPGSNTVSMFKISPHNPTKLTPVGCPTSSLGDFPMSITISQKLKMACVANSGAIAGISCFSMSTVTGLTPIGGLRPFNLNQTTPPMGPLNTVSQVLFNEDSTSLLTTVKGDGKNNTGFLSVFPVVNGAVSMTETRSSPAGTAVLFGSAVIPGQKNSLFATDASFGSATLQLSQNNTASVSASTKIADQVATCWATISTLTNTAFVSDVAANHLVEVDTGTGAIVKETQLTDASLGNANPGLTDLEAMGNFIFALSPGNATTATAVTVMDISGGKGTAKQIQNFVVNGLSDAAAGMAVF